MKARTWHIFHVGRGGRFYNAGHKTYHGSLELTNNEVENRIIIHQDLTFYERDSNGRFAYVFVDDTGKEMITLSDLRKDIQYGFVMLEFDTIYDTWMFKTEKHLLESEINIIENNE